MGAFSTYCLSECPTCGRSLRISVALLGRELVCQHCGGAFTANDPSLPNQADRLLQRAEQLLDAVKPPPRRHANQ
ncbi:MAG: hypothetical protein N2C14_25590 [Planctomycetales bacterium]